MRRRTFKTNLRKIRDLNKYEQGTATYGITEFVDFTATEYKMRTGLLYDKSLENNDITNQIAQIPDFKLPSEFDWRTKNVVSPVKDQKSCGSCWAFSVVGNIEGLNAIKMGSLSEFSEQELLDCDDIDKACQGGLPDDAYKAIEQIGGLEFEKDYPYKAQKNQCAFNKTKSHVTVTGAVDLPKNETAMALWLLQNGPISIGINANAMQFYRGGISHPWHILCAHDKLDHGVLIVGFGVANYPKFNKTLPYWIVKNSWGPAWGERGYYRVFRNDNTCGVKEMASSAVLD
jgi:cathepsin F